MEMRMTKNVARWAFQDAIALYQNHHRAIPFCRNLLAASVTA
jgi:hypothetical protein